MGVSATVGLPLDTTAEDLLAALDESRRNPNGTRARMRAELQAFEDAYGFASADVREAVRDGLLSETHEICSWMFTYDALVRFRA